MKQRLYSALEIAALDLCGRALKKPVCDLLGGRVRDEVPFSAYPFYKHAGGGGEGADARADEYGEALAPEPLVHQVKRMVSQCGFRDIKFKTGVLDPEVEIETVRQLHRAFPGLPIRMDPNCAWSVETSLRVGKALVKELGNGGYLEDPTAGMDGMAAVRRGLLEAGIETPLGSNVAVTCFPDLEECVRKNAVQVVLCDVHYWGGLRAVQHLGKLCKTFGLGLSMHSNSHLGISVMAMAHAAAVTPQLTYACDTHYPWSDAKDEVVAGGKIKFANGTRRTRTASGTTKPKCASTWTRTGNESFRGGDSYEAERLPKETGRRHRVPRDALQGRPLARHPRAEAQPPGASQAPALRRRGRRRDGRALLPHAGGTP